jgi:hypothetical protein
VLELDTCLHSNASSERTEILSGRLTERDSEAKRSLDTCMWTLSAVDADKGAHPALSILFTALRGGVTVIRDA